MADYLEASAIIDWKHPAILSLAGQIASAPQIASAHGTEIAIAKASFEWVRDKIFHSIDYQMNPVTCCASEVLQHKTGFCYAKSHLLAALLRANNIPTGFCYQRLSIDDIGPPYSLHGFNAVRLPEIGWYRLDPRGNRQGINAQFAPPQEHLAYASQLPEEATFQNIFPEPLPIVVQSLQTHQTVESLLVNLPDISLEAAKKAGFVIRA